MSKVRRTAITQIPGVGTGSAYAALDAMGTIFTLAVPDSGIIVGARYYDLDDEGLGMKLWLFRSTVTGAADNAAFLLSDADLQLVEGVVSFSNFHDANTGQVATEDGLYIPYVANESLLYCLMQCLGASNIAASNVPLVSLYILPD